MHVCAEANTSSDIFVKKIRAEAKDKGTPVDETVALLVAAAKNREA